MCLTFQISNMDLNYRFGIVSASQVLNSSPEEHSELWTLTSAHTQTVHSHLPANHLYAHRTRSRLLASLLPLTILRSLMPVWETARICTPVPTLP